MCDELPAWFRTLPWDRSYDRASFDCGNNHLNEWLRKQAGQFVRRGQTRIHCVLLPDANAIGGFYSLSSHTVEVAIVAVSRDVGVRLIQVHAIDDDAKNFYVKYGFTSLIDNQRHLFYSVAMAEKLYC